MRVLFFVFLPLFSFAQHAVDTTATWLEENWQHRQKYIQDLYTDEHGPLEVEDTSFLDFFPFDSSFHIEAEIELLQDKDPIIMTTVNGSQKQYIPYLIARFSLAGVEQELTVYRSVRLMKIPMYSDYLFLPFYDHTNGEQTYGGGRYLDLKISDLKENTIYIDFNRVYNPYCAFKSGYACPIPPVSNTVSGNIEAGEKSFQKDQMH